jgi:Spy/CpxP family protein refolding chaperone
MRALFALAAILASAGALAQDHHPYAGMERRPIKALSDQQIADLRAGRGMGLALAAELNGYPGPAHTLENADALGLTAEQRARTQALFDAMKAEAVPLGAQLIEQERTLDHLFADRRIDNASLEETTRAIGLTEAKLRQTHLKYHLAMIEVLAPSQVEAYRQLRGYGSMQHRHDHQ